MPLSKLWKGGGCKGKKLTVLYNYIKEKEREQQRLLSVDEHIPWFNARIQISSLAIRFGLPMDVRDLKNFDIMTYLYKFCKIPQERMLVYLRFYKNHKPTKSKFIQSAVFPRAIQEVLYDCVTEKDVSRLLQIIGITQDNTTTIDMKTFAVVTATAERILYMSFAESAGPVPPGTLKPFEECADFSMLAWKLDEISIDPALKRLLLSL